MSTDLNIYFAKFYEAFFSKYKELIDLYITYKDKKQSGTELRQA